MPIVDRLRADLGRPRRAAPLGPRRGRASRRVAPDPGRRRRTSSSGPASRCSRRSPTSAWSSSTRSTRRPTRATARPGSRRAMPRWRSGQLAGAAVVLGSATPAVESVGRARDGQYRRATLPARPAGSVPPSIELVDLRAELAAGNRGLLSPLARRRRSRRSIATPASGRSSSSTGVARRRSSCAATAAPSRHARSADGRSSSIRPAARCAATTAARVAARVALPGVRLAAHPLPRGRDGAGRARGPRAVRRRCGSAGSTATSSSAGARRIACSTRSRRPDRRPRGDEPRGEGASTSPR